MFRALKKLEDEGKQIRVGVVGCGAMGLGVAIQVEKTPGMSVAMIGDTNAEALGRTEQYVSGATVTQDPLSYLQSEAAGELDALVECTNAIGQAAEYCLAAIERKAHVVLMNAEVDLALGPLLARRAAEQGVVVTSDAGDQHGVLARMIDEIQLWNFDIVQAGNIKGFLDRHATAEGLLEEAAKRKLNPVQCCAYTDGTKLCVEMAIVGNAFGLIPTRPGMEGPKCGHVTEVVDLFDFDSYGGQGRVDYILGAEPGGGVYVVGRCDDPLQADYLNYYKLGEKPPYYVFYRPYHLCHVETPSAIAQAYLGRGAVLAPTAERPCDVYAYAKRDIPAGTEIEHCIGSDFVFGLIEATADGGSRNALPITWLEPDGAARARIVRDVPKETPLSLDDVEFPDTQLHRRLKEQANLPSEG